MLDISGIPVLPGGVLRTVYGAGAWGWSFAHPVEIIAMSEVASLSTGNANGKNLDKLHALNLTP
jgi:hypothetical protein